MTSREHWLRTLRDLMDGRPVRWAEGHSIVGDYDGRERTLEVFNADAKEQRLLVRKLRAVRADLEATAGGPVVVIFHTSGESTRLYSDYVQSALREEATDDITVSEYEISDDARLLGLDDVELTERDGTQPGGGAARSMGNRAGRSSRSHRARLVRHEATGRPIPVVVA